MWIAIDDKNNRISIDKASKTESYYCPVCGAPLIVKNKGIKRRPHFAHKNTLECDWGDMSEWHLSWQEAFPKICRERVLEKDGVKHRADILVSKHNTVIEFQHSPISSEEFNQRNAFYTSCGYKLVWVFDATDKIKPCNKNDKLNDLMVFRDRIWDLMWKRKCNTFSNFERINKDRNITIFLDVGINDQHQLFYIKTMTEKYIGAYAFYEPIYRINFFKSYGIIQDRTISSIKQLNLRTEKRHKMLQEKNLTHGSIMRNHRIG